MKRLVNSVRLQFENATTNFWVPALIAAATILIVVLVGLIIPSTDHPSYTGAALAPIWFFATAGIQALIFTLPFALAMGLTRWEFSVSTVMAAAGAGGILALMTTLLGWIEQLSGGWFVNQYAFYMPWVWMQGPIVAWLLFLAASMVVFEIAFGLSVVFKRYGLVTLVLVLLVVTLVLVGVIWVITSRSAWPQVIQWMIGLSPLQVSLGGLLFSVAVSALSFLALRKYELR